MKNVSLIFIFVFLAISLQAQLPKVLEDDITESYNWILGVATSKTCNTGTKLTEKDIVETPVEQCQFIEAFEMFPNPTKSNVTVSFEGQKQPTQLIISGLDGRALLTEKLPAFNGIYNEEINIEKIPSGIYLFSIIQGKEAFVKKLIIQ